MVIPVPEVEEEKMPGLNSIIHRLLEVRGSRPGKAVQLTEKEIRDLCTHVSWIYNPEINNRFSREIFS